MTTSAQMKHTSFTFKAFFCIPVPVRHQSFANLWNITHLQIRSNFSAPKWGDDRCSIYTFIWTILQLISHQWGKFSLKYTFLFRNNYLDHPWQRLLIFNQIHDFQFYKNHSEKFSIFINQPCQTRLRRCLLSIATDAPVVVVVVVLPNKLPVRVIKNVITLWIKLSLIYFFNMKLQI